MASLRATDGAPGCPARRRVGAAARPRPGPRASRPGGRRTAGGDACGAGGAIPGADGRFCGRLLRLIGDIPGLPSNRASSPHKCYCFQALRLAPAARGGTSASTTSGSQPLLSSIPFQGVAYSCRLSCATPVLAPVAGFLGVFTASAVAGQASAALTRWRRDGARSRPKRLPRAAPQPAQPQPVQPHGSLPPAQQPTPSASAAPRRRTQRSIRWI